MLVTDGSVGEAPRDYWIGVDGKREEMMGQGNTDDEQ